jgi:hypothetical protein
LDEPKKVAGADGTKQAGGKTEERTSHRRIESTIRCISPKRQQTQGKLWREIAREAAPGAKRFCSD